MSPDQNLGAESQALLFDCGHYVTHHLDKHLKRFHDSAYSLKSSKNQAYQSKRRNKQNYILSVGNNLFFKKKNNQYNILIDFLCLLQECLELPCQLRIFLGRKILFYFPKRVNFVHNVLYKNLLFSPPSCYPDKYPFLCFHSYICTKINYNPSIDFDACSFS